MLENKEQHVFPNSVEEMRQLIASVLYGGRAVRLAFKGGRKRNVQASFDDAKDEIELGISADEAAGLIAVTVDGYNTSYSFAAAGLSQVATPNRLSLPQKVRRQQRRAKSRATAPSGWEIRYLDTNQVTVCRCIFDISLDGLSMRGGPEDENRFSGRVLTPVTIYDGTTKVCSLVAELRNITYVTGNQGLMTYGMSLHALHNKDWRAWECAVNRVLHPNTKDARNASHEVWNLFDKSGYFNLSNKQPEQFKAQKQSHDAFNRILEENPELGTHVMWHGGADVCASLSSCMFYAHTSVLHQGATVPGTAANRVVLRDMLIHSFEYLKQQPSLHYVAALLNATVSFNKYAFLSFAEAHKKYDVADLLQFSLIEFDAKEPRSFDCEFTISEASPQDYPMIAKSLIASRGNMYAEAFDQTMEKLSGAVATLRWRDVGIERQRRIYIARDRDDAPIAAAIVDVSPTGSNLFSIFDAFTTFSLTPGETKADPIAIKALLAVSRRWFARIGRERFVWHDFDEQAPDVVGDMTGVKDLGVGHVWVIKREAIATLQEFWYTHLMIPRKKGAKPERTTSEQASVRLEGEHG